MRRYERVSAAFFSVLALIHLGRVILGWPIQVATVTVPTWPSIVAFLVTGSLAMWGFRAARATA